MEGDLESGRHRFWTQEAAILICIKTNMHTYVTNIHRIAKIPFDWQLGGRDRKDTKGASSDGKRYIPSPPLRLHAMGNSRDMAISA